jgi:ubiquinone/menaquinone biosynthesis C-methylase UbiE
MFTNPEKNILRLGLKEGMRVADLGAGTGFYAKEASKRVGYTGKVYAIEVQRDLVRKLESDIKHSGISNIDCIWGDIEKKGGTKISDGSIDAVIISNVLSQTEDKLGLIDEARRILKKNGKVLFIDWSDSFGGGSLNGRNFLSEDKVRELFEKRGFKFFEKISTTEHHYGIIFTYE